MTEIRHASFFTGAGGLDLGLEWAGFRTVSVSEIDRYASALLAQLHPDVPNLGDIRNIDPEDIPDAEIWSGGFPCQDLSTAGKRRGFGGDRSVLAFTFLDLVERRRPRWLVLENVPGLLTSNAGRDALRLVSELADLGYMGSLRTLDAQFFGVAQRRRRVFLVASRDSDRACSVLFESDSGSGDPDPGGPPRAALAGPPGDGAAGGFEPIEAVAGTLTGRYAKGINTTVDDGSVAVRVRRPTPDPDGVREVDGLAGRVHHRPRLATADVAGTLQAPRTGGYRFDVDGVESHLIVASLGSEGPHGMSPDLVPTLRVGPQSVDAGGPGDTVPVVAYRKATHPHSDDTPERWERAERIDTLAPSNINATAVVGSSRDDDDPRLPVGLDGHRYRLTGNGVAAPVAYWIGRRLRAEHERWIADG